MAQSAFYAFATLPSPLANAFISLFLRELTSSTDPSPPAQAAATGDADWLALA
jgi:hypothetical protein